jgi:hypothetical protein
MEAPPAIHREFAERQNTFPQNNATSTHRECVPHRSVFKWWGQVQYHRPGISAAGVRICGCSCSGALQCAIDGGAITDGGTNTAAAKAVWQLKYDPDLMPV